MASHPRILVFLSLFLCVPSSFATVLPPDFTEETVASSLSLPVSFDFFPDGRAIIAEQKSGDLHLVLADDTQVGAAMFTVPDLDTLHNEAGLLSVVVDALWPTSAQQAVQRPYFYVWYDSASGDDQRLTRYTVTGDLFDGLSSNLSVVANSAVDLLTGVPDDAGNHNGGTLRFGPDGYLYLSTGDDEVKCSAQNRFTYLGKILRMRVDNVPDENPVTLLSLAPTTNPFFGQGGVANLVWAMGLRNPFRMYIDDLTGAVYVGDVGWVSMEEISCTSEGGSNFGWPFREGTLVQQIPGCQEPGGPGSTQYHDPIVTYAHTAGPKSVIPTAVYRWPAGGTDPWPIDYVGDFFYMDYYSGNLTRMQGSDQTWSVAPPVPGQPSHDHWATGMAFSADFHVGPDGSMYYVQMLDGGSNTGALRRIVYTGVTDSIPPRTGLRWHGAVPNPFNPSTMFRFELADGADVDLDVLDARGRVVRNVVLPDEPAGLRSFHWDGEDDRSRPVASGVYRIRVRARGEMVEGSATLVR